MLLYVDKKKEKRERLKRTILYIFLFFVVVINLIHFNIALHQTSNTLSTFPIKAKKSDWYNHISPIIIFKKQNTTSPQIIVIPQELSKQNLYTIAKAFSKISPTLQTISFTKEVSDIDYLLELAHTYNPNLTLTTKGDIIITTDKDTIINEVYKNELYPYTINYKSIKNKNNLAVNNLIERKYPTKPTSENLLDIEQENLINFANNYNTEIKNLTKQQKTIPFKKHHIFLQNIPLCLQRDNLTACTLSKTDSFIKNLKTTQNKLKTPAQRLFLLTNLQEITIKDTLYKDEGLYFTLKGRNTLLLPMIIKDKSTKEAFAFIKQNAGINPHYHSKDMKFYKFKTVEIKLDDNI